MTLLALTWTLFLVAALALAAVSMAVGLRAGRARELDRRGVPLEER